MACVLSGEKRSLEQAAARMRPWAGASADTALIVDGDDVVLPRARRPARSRKRASMADAPAADKVLTGATVPGGAPQCAIGCHDYPCYVWLCRL